MKYDKESRSDLANLDNFVDAIAKHDWQWGDGDYDEMQYCTSQERMFSSLADELPTHRAALDKQIAANAELKAQIGRELRSCHWAAMVIDAASGDLDEDCL